MIKKSKEKKECTFTGIIKIHHELMLITVIQSIVLLKLIKCPGASFSSSKWFSVRRWVAVSDAGLGRPWAFVMCV